MKIAFYATTIMEHGGGLEKYFIETANNLSKIPNVRVDIITMDDKFTEKIAKILGFYYFKKINRSSLYKETSGSITERLGGAHYYKCKNFKELRKKLNEYDAVYSKNELLEALILKLFIKYKNIPFVVFGCHTPIYYPVADSLQSKLHNFLYNKFLYKWLASGVKVFHVTNSADKILLERMFPYQKVTKIYNPSNIAQFKADIKQHIFDFKWNRSKCNILWVARLVEQKGVSSLINIIEKINNTDMQKRVIFNIVGNGQLDNDIANLKKKWDNVNWFGYVEYRYLLSIYAQSDIFISTSKWEAFGLNILEAQASGLPAIAFDIPGPQDIIQNGKTGFLVDDEQEFYIKIISMVKRKIKFKNDKIAQSMNQIFSPDIIYPELLKMFLEVVQK